MLALAHSGNVYAAGLAMFVTGLAWISVVSSLMTATQTALPGWVRARGLALFWVIFMGGMAAGSTLWGQVASWFGIPAALTLAAIGAVIGIAVTWRFRIRRRDGAYLWELFSDVEDPARQLECFMVESWVEHLRQHERVTFADRDITAMAQAFHVGSEPPKVTHLVAGVITPALASPTEPPH